MQVAFLVRLFENRANAVFRRIKDCENGQRAPIFLDRFKRAICLVRQPEPELFEVVVVVVVVVDLYKPPTSVFFRRRCLELLDGLQIVVHRLHASRLDHVAELLNATLEELAFNQFQLISLN